MTASLTATIPARGDLVSTRHVLGERPAVGGPAADPALPGLWRRIRHTPQYTPEHLALAAVQRLGPEAREWARRTRARHPGADNDLLAGRAVRKFACYAALSGAFAAAAGLPGVVVDVGLLAYNQTRMVLHIAAVHGHDPTDPDRATELLVLARVQPAAERVRLALDVAAGRETVAGLLSRSTIPLAQVASTVAIRLTRLAGARTAKRLATRSVPGAAVVLGTVGNVTATVGLARRARQMYRLGPRSTG